MGESKKHPKQRCQHQEVLCLHVEKGLVEQQALDILAQTIKEDMPIWLAQMKRYAEAARQMDDDY